MLTIRNRASIKQDNSNGQILMQRKGITFRLGQITKYLFEDNERNPSFSIKETKHFEFLFTKYVTNCGFQCLFALISIVSSIIEYEHTVIESQTIPRFYIHTHVQNQTIIDTHQIDPELFSNAYECARVATFITFASSVFLWVTIVFDFIFDMQIEVFPKKLRPSEAFSDKFTVFMVGLTLVFFIPSPNPFTFGIDVSNVSDKYSITYNVPVNAYLTSLVLSRLWFVLKLYLVKSKYYTPRIFRICNMNSFQPSLSFPFKCFMSCNPFVFDSFLFIISLFFCSYNLRIFERYTDSEGDNLFGNLLNCLWCIFNTMGTLGFGDYSPSSWLGRIFIMIGCLCGVLLVSVVVVSVSSYLNIKGSELNVYTVINKAFVIEEKKSKAEDVAIKFISAAKNQIYFEKNKEDEKKKIKLLDSLKSFSHFNDEINSTYNNYSEFDSILEHMKFLESRLINNKKTFKNLICSINKLKKLLLRNKAKNSFSISNYNEQSIPNINQ